MSNTPIYGVRDLIAPNLDSAVHAVALRNEGVMWEMVTAMVNSPQGPMVQWMLQLSAPNPLLGGGSLMGSTPLDPRELLDEQVAFDYVRGLVENLRQMRAQILSAANGSGLEMP